MRGFGGILAQAQAALGRPDEALDSYGHSLECVDEVLSWESGSVPSRVTVLMAAGDLCAATSADGGLGDVGRAQEYYKKAAMLGACPGVWFRLGKSCAELGQLIDAEDAFTKVTAMDNAHARVWAEMCKLCLRAQPAMRLGDARLYADLAFEHRLESRDALHDLADAFLEAASERAQDAGATETARAYAERSLRQSLALGEDPAVRSRLVDVLTSEDEKEACRMFLSPRRGPALN